MLRVNSSIPALRVAMLTALAILAMTTAAFAVPVNFSEYGTTVHGYQDDFNGITLNPEWTVQGQNVYSVAGGIMHVAGASGDPNHLVYTPANPLNDYSGQTQDILALVRINTIANNDSGRGGVVTQNTTGNEGENLLFRTNGNNGNGDHLNILNDHIAWQAASPGPTDYVLGDWYWMRLHNDGTTVTGHFWVADGVTPESSGISISDTNGRLGLAGFTSSSGDTSFSMDVDYVLIRSAKLPSINVVPEPGSLVLFGLGGLGIALAAWRRRSR